MDDENAELHQRYITDTLQEGGSGESRFLYAYWGGKSLKLPG